MHPKYIPIEDYNYQLPDEQIAKEPLSIRDSAQLLIYQNSNIQTSSYQNIAKYLPAKSLVCFNETKVINARLYFQKSTGGKIEIFCLEPSDKYADVTVGMLQKNAVYWKCLVGGVSKWKNEEKITCSTPDNKGTLFASIHKKLTDGYEILFEWDNDASFAEILHAFGEIPLPPYLNRKAEESDYKTYQTIFAKHEGSVAAPTASLHFTNQVLESFAQNNIQTTKLTLHVGAGTFKPVKSELMDEHEMHPEFIEIEKQSIQNILNQIVAKENVIAVGTTSVRTLESLYWIGNLLALGKTIKLEDISVTQWMPYELPAETEPTTALKQVLNYLEQHNLDKLITRTQIIIAPGYTFKIVNGIVTNFHQPKSTLLLLISAFMGKEWKNMYDYALAHNFRFLSYGDGCLLLK